MLMMLLVLTAPNFGDPGDWNMISFMDPSIRKVVYEAELNNKWCECLQSQGYPKPPYDYPGPILMPDLKFHGIDFNEIPPCRMIESITTSSGTFIIPKDRSPNSNLIFIGGSPPYFYRCNIKNGVKERMGG